VTWEGADICGHTAVGFGIGLRPIRGREDGRQLRPWYQSVDGGLRQGSRHERHDVDRSQQDRPGTREDHTKTSSELKQSIGDVKAEIPGALDSSSQSKVDKPKNAKPDEFSSTFDSMQVSAHKDAVSLFERHARGGDSPKLKDWAGKTLPHLQHHLEMAQRLGKKK
jgi:Domain of unknown function (DUF4142)